MSPNNNLPAGFSSLEEAVALIKSDTRENPVVDMDWLVDHLVWLDRNGPNHNFRIPRVRQLSPEEVYTNRYGKIVEYESTGELNVYIADGFENELLKKTIKDKYRELVGHEYRGAGIKAMSTVADDAQGVAAVQPRKNAKPIAKEGDFVGNGEVLVSNGEGIL